LAFIHAYTLVLGRPPAEADLQRFFRVTPPSVHQMVLTLGTQRPDPPSARHRSEHQGVGRSRSTAALTRQLRSTRQILCAELL